MGKKFLALTSRGLNEALESELNELGISKTKTTSSGVYFDGNWRDCYSVNLYSRLATRVLYPILDFPAYNPEDLYYNTQKHDFTKYITPDQTISIHAKVRESAFQDQRFVAMKVKDAIVDQFMKKFDCRPSVDKNPDLEVFVKIVKNQVSFSLNTTGRNLSLRGYREEAGIAPLKEHLASGLLKLAGWTPDMPLLDPMCGAGTFLIEAALMYKRPYKPHNQIFAFKNWKTFQEDAWDEALANIPQIIKDYEGKSLNLYGYDYLDAVLKKAQRNARRARVDKDLNFRIHSIDEAVPPVDWQGRKGIIIVNPPYGRRIGSNSVLPNLYESLSTSLKENFSGWTAWILSGDSDLTHHLKLKSSQKYRVFNGDIECRFIKYEIR